MNRGKREFNLEDIREILPNGVMASHFSVGEGASATSVFYGSWPANIEVAAHTHGSDYCEIVLKGKQRVGKKWYRPGDVRIAKGGTNYGPLATGPEGCDILIIFNGTDWVPRPARKEADAGLYVQKYEQFGGQTS